MDILQKIINQLRQDEEKNFNDFDKKHFVLKSRPPPLPLGSGQPFFLIAEIKKASPSRGVIREHFDPVAIAQSYIQGKASALSIITEKNFFQGDKKYLAQIRELTKLPLLRKDFIIHPYQVYESFNLGADLVLLIAAALGEDDLISLYRDIQSLGLTPLIEVHNREELARALALKPQLIGINNRDLKTFAVDISLSLTLKKFIPDSIPVISESGIFTAEHIRILKNEGFAGALIGESLLRQENLIQALTALEI